MSESHEYFLACKRYQADVASSRVEFNESLWET